MGGHPADLWGEALARAYWRPSLRFVVLDATPLQPGRRRSRTQANRKGRRLPSVDQELDFLELHEAIVGGLRDGSLGAIEARRRVDQAGFGDSLRVAETRVEMVDACAHFAQYGFALGQVGGDQDPDSPILLVSFALPSELRRT